MRPLRLVGKPDCPLCHEARGIVERVAAEMGLDVEWADVGSDPALEIYRDQVPVVLSGNRVLARLRVREETLRERLKDVSPTGSPPKRRPPSSRWGP